MRIEIVPAKLGHCLVVARRMQFGAMLPSGTDPRAVMKRAFLDSRRVLAMIVDGKTAAVGGWQGQMLSGEKEAWLAVTPLALSHWRALARAVRHEADSLALGGNRILADVKADNPRGIRFAEFCGLARMGEDNGTLRMAG